MDGGTVVDTQAAPSRSTSGRVVCRIRTNTAGNWAADTLRNTNISALTSAFGVHVGAHTLANAAAKLVTYEFGYTFK